KALKKKKPTRRDTVQYWSESQFEGLKGALPGKLYSKGPLPWRLLAYLLKVAPEVSKVRNVLRKRLMDAARVKSSETHLARMLLPLAEHGFVPLDPPPPAPVADTPGSSNAPVADAPGSSKTPVADAPGSSKTLVADAPGSPSPAYEVVRAMPTEALDKLL